MGEQRQLRAIDGFTFGAYEARPEGTAKGAILVVQEIFGVNNHIREVCDGYAQAGYVALAPQIFDRVERDVELGYDDAGMTAGVGIARGKLDIADTLKDLQASIEDLSRHGKVGVVGYCFGGLLTWLAACDLDGVACASSYYGGGVVGEIERSARCPVIMHFGELDAHIPMSDVARIDAALPDVTVYSYNADHGFNCDHRESFNAEAAAQAKERSLAFFAEHLS
jgi:carboxymethylenebutenolidase